MNDYKYLISTTFYLRGELLEPEKITRELFVEPTRSYKKGDVVLSGAGEKHARKIGIWSLEQTGESKTTDMVSEQILSIVSQLKKWDPKMIDEYNIEDPFLDIYIAMNCPDMFSSTCDFLLSPSDLHMVSNLHVPLKITVDMVQNQSD